MRFLVLFLSLWVGGLVFSDDFAFGEQVFLRAKKENRLIFLFIGSDVCLESRAFLSGLVQDDEYMQLLENDFIFAILDYDLNPALAVRYSIPTIPGFLILDADGLIFLGGTKPEKDELFPVLIRLRDTWQYDPGILKQELREFQKGFSAQNLTSVVEVLDSTRDYPNHISLDMGRYIYSLPVEHSDFRAYMEQLIQWIRSENFDDVDGSFFMPRGFSTYFAESKYSFFNFRLLDLLLDFYLKTKHIQIKMRILKSLKLLKRDLDLGVSAYSTGYASKKYFKLALRDRLRYFPPSPRNFDLAISQILYLKILYKLELLQDRGFFGGEDIGFLRADMAKKTELFTNLLSRYGRDDGLLYFTPQKDFTNLETQLDFFSLLHLIKGSTETDRELFLQRMLDLFRALTRLFYDQENGMFLDVPRHLLQENPRLYQYPLFFVREHARLLVFIDYLYEETKDENYQRVAAKLLDNVRRHDERYPQQFYWLKWYERVSNKGLH